MKFEAKNLSPVAFHALICVEVSVSIKCFDWSKMAAEVHVFPVARIDEYANLKPCEPAIHVFRSVRLFLSLRFWPRFDRFKPVLTGLNLVLTAFRSK